MILNDELRKLLSQNIVRPVARQALTVMQSFKDTTGCLFLSSVFINQLMIDSNCVTLCFPSNTRYGLKDAVLIVKSIPIHYLYLICYNFL